MMGVIAWLAGLPSDRLPRVVMEFGTEPDKGYQLMLAVARLLLQSHDDIRILAHNGARRTMAATQQTMRDLAAADRRVSVDDRLADPAIWAELLEASDLIVRPYPPDRYALGYSAVVAEAIANAIPVVVPAGTALPRLLREFDGPGTTFADHAAPAVAAAVEEALRHYDRLAEIASSAAERWTQKNGPQPVVDAILALGRAPDPQGTTLVRCPATLSIG